MYDRAKRDNQRILGERGFRTEITFTNPVTSSVQPIEGFYVDAPYSIDPQTGIPIRARRIAIHVPLSEFDAGGTPVDVDGDWLVQFVNNSGHTVLGVLKDVAPDRTLDMLTATVTTVEVIN